MNVCAVCHAGCSPTIFDLKGLTTGQGVSQDTGGSEKTVKCIDRIERSFHNLNKIFILKLRLKVTKTGTSCRLATRFGTM